MLASCYRLTQRRNALLCCCAVEKYRKVRLRERLIEVGRPTIDAVGMRDFGEPLGVAPNQKQARHKAIGPIRQATFCADRHQRTRQVLGRRDAAGRAVDDDADFLDRQFLDPFARLLIISPTPLLDASWYLVNSMPRHIVCLTFDFDTQSGFIARGMTTPTPLSRGEFGAIASLRILDFLKSRGIKTTWFIPGFTIESWPRECNAVVEDGHEVAHHSWAHVPPATQTRDLEEADLVRANDAIIRLSGRKARGYRSPSWDLSEHTIELLLKHGFRYDSSLMGADYAPYRARRGDVAKLGEPFRFGEQTELMEMPISWSLDDYPHFEFVRTESTILAGLQSARTVMQSWFDEFLYMKKTVEWGVLTYTMHPYVIGRGYRMLALEQMVDKLADEGAVFMRLENAAREAEQQLTVKPI